MPNYGRCGGSAYADVQEKLKFHLPESPADRYTIEAKENAMRTRRTMSLLFLTVIVMTACNLPGSNPQQYDFNQVSTFAAQTVEAAATQGIRLATNTPASAGNATAAPTTATTPAANSTSDPACNRASFVTDVSIPDDTEFIVEKPFKKTWRLKNAGSCTWTTDYKLVFDSGYRMGAPASQPLTTSAVPPGGTLDISVDLTAPALAGTYRSNWKIEDPSGGTFALASGPFWVQIKVRRGGVNVWRTFKQGDAAPEVFAIQYLLRQNGHSVLADGVFGADTRNKVSAFQASKGIDEDGIVAWETWEELIVEVSQGRNGDAVRAAQYLLRQKYNFTLEVDGVFGPLTAQAVKDFQSKQGLTADGVVDALTWQKLIGR